MKLRSLLLCSLVLLTLAARTRGDEFTYLDEEGEKVTIQARLLASKRGLQFLERADGQIQPVPSAAVLDRVNSGDPEPYDSKDIADHLREVFTPELTRVEIQGQSVVVMVLAAPLASSAEGPASEFIKKAARFMNSVNGVFEKYAVAMKFPLRELRYPLVMIIFEAESDFDDYARDATGGDGLSVASIIGFYSQLTNWLAVRMSACDSFELPLHEAIHQQMFNRVQQRFGPDPKWFSEGIANGFEGNGDRVNSNPLKVNTRYARQAMELPPGTKWSSVAGKDASFTADVLAGDAYTLAWCIHWQLCSQHKEEYQKYVQALAKRGPLDDVSEEEEARLFQSTFGLSMDQLQAQFPTALQSAIKKQKIVLKAPPAGVANSGQAMGQYNINAAAIPNLGGRILVDGALRNISPLRPMTFYVTVETEGGMYTDWLIPDLKPRARATLTRQMVSKLIPGREVTSGGSSYRVFIRSVPAESPESASWKAGDLPLPVTAN